MNQLDVLKLYRDSILLGEAIGWLHNYRKCSDEFLSGSGLERNYLVNSMANSLKDAVFSIPDFFDEEKIDILLNHSEGKQNDNRASLLLRYLSRCHRTAHFDKQEPIGVKSDHPIQISTPFGFEMDTPSNLTEKLISIPWNALSSYTKEHRSALKKEAHTLFSQTVADTRRPINEVNLWSWGLLVGSLYKSTISGAILTKTTPSVVNLRWRLLSIRINENYFLLNVSRIPDLLARKGLLADGLDGVKDLLEVTYPLGSEIFRDEKGSIFVVPDIPELLDIKDRKNRTIRDLIIDAFSNGSVKGSHKLQIGDELVPQIDLETESWWGQDPQWSKKSIAPSNDELPGIASLLSKTVLSSSKAEEIAHCWNTNKIKEVCTVCSLRPIGPSKKADERKVCDICEERRADRSKEWATYAADETIWTDEVADINGRLALITSKYSITHWIDGSLLSSLLVSDPYETNNDPGKQTTSKSLSFSRLHRIWQTTQLFWEEIDKDMHQFLMDDRQRLIIKLNGIPHLAPFHVYDMVIGATKLNLVWVPPENGGYLISADNLGYIARQLYADYSIYGSSAASAIYVEDYLTKSFIKNHDQPVLINPDGKANEYSKNLIDGLQIKEIEYQERSFAVTVPILSEPRGFMALVPANKALAVVDAIKVKYEREMGKVRNRLPLHVGVVYFHRRTPLRAALDAGHRMLSQKPPGEDRPWTVCKNPQSGPLPDPKAVLGQGTQQFQKTISVPLEQNGRSFIWHVPAFMGDGKTKDIWYPYAFIDTQGDESRIAERERVFKGRRPTQSGQRDCWLIHAGDLKADDRIYFTPATFDFEWLDTSGRRFEIAYNDDGMRLGRRCRPYLLDDLETIREAWNWIAGDTGLTSSQIHALRDTIESRRKDWEPPPDDPMFQSFCRNAITNAAWGRQPENEIKDNLSQWAASGLLTDVIELFMEIMKQKPKREERDEVTP